MQTNNSEEKKGEKKEEKKGEKKKEKKKKTDKLNIVSVDLEEDVNKLVDNKESKVKQEHVKHSNINAIDLFYLTNQSQNVKTNKLEQLLNNNSLLKEIYENLGENLTIFKDQIVKYNNNSLEKLLENTNNNTNTNTNTNEKYKLYYLLYVLNLILHLKEKKIKNSIKNELKEYSNNNSISNNSLVDEFNINNETINYMSATDNSKKLTNLDLFVVRKSNKINNKILPQKRE